MDQSAIFAPVFVMICLTMVVWVYMYIRRITFFRTHQIDPEKITPADFAQLSPPAVYNPSDNLKNLFEIPVLFYVLAFYLFVTDQVDMSYLIASYIFVSFRVLHSIIHCSINIVMLRFFVYVTSTVSLWFIAIRAAIQYLS